jgi:hypothetical protein
VLSIREGVVVFTPERDAEARELDLPRVAFSPRAAGREHDAISADAYASTERMLEEAIAWARSEDRAARRRGPLRVVYIGSLDDDPVTRAAPIGKAAVLGDRPLVIGRAQDCDVCLRQGAHSDQNTVARKNTKIELVGGRVTIADLGSTNGTRVVGDEIIVGLGHRLRLDGARGR